MGPLISLRFRDLCRYLRHFWHHTLPCKGTKLFQTRDATCAIYVQSSYSNQCSNQLFAIAFLNRIISIASTKTRWIDNQRKQSKNLHNGQWTLQDKTNLLCRGPWGLCFAWVYIWRSNLPRTFLISQATSANEKCLFHQWLRHSSLVFWRSRILSSPITARTAVFVKRDTALCPRKQVTWNWRFGFLVITPWDLR